ncbi:ABC transporter substrate-binding protein [Cohnella cholangitidis]|uniref:Carbohydrate ABC transporter substrate-binding protein n=1 Tax=Cohnella cholangitidis TaxID=2598458 RepID=A0A7G5C415_9BACL|nr:ABC transporter substrate-binding protein [Cohnella cholangitidis]QMV43949.1 carbohydrate ABC transporter substrate-binding protein [Cohnella cholangitidis]
MKKNLLLASALVMSMGLFAACGKNNNEASPSASSSAPASQAASETVDSESGSVSDLGGKITFVSTRTDMKNNGALDKYAAKFKEKYPKAEFEWVAITDYAQEIKVRLTTGEAGDVSFLDASLPLSELPNYYEPLPDSLFDDAYFADFKAWEGKRYGLATGVNTQGIVYNKAAFKTAGIDKVPTTLDELYAAAEKLKAANIVPLYMNVGAMWPITNWGENGVWYVAGQGNFFDQFVNDEAPYKMDNAWGTLLSIGREFVERGYTEKDLATNNWELSKGEVATGKAGMYFLGNWVIPQLIEAGAKPEDIGFFPLPYDNKGGSYNVPRGPDYFIGVSKDSKNKELAFKWVEFFVKESGYTDAGGYLPVYKSQSSNNAQLSEFDSFKPTYIESVASDPKFNEIGNKAEIDLYGGKYIQKILISKDIQAEFDALNAKWKKAKEALGY